MQRFLCKTMLTLALSFLVSYAQAQSISISASTADTICTGTPVTFTAATSYVGPHYQWLKNSIHVGTDASTYPISTLANGDVIMCELLNAPSGTILALSGPIVMTVEHIPAVSAIAGTSTICRLSTTTLTNDSLGGIWSSSNPLIAPVSAGGVVTGANIGTDTISYTLTNSCGTADATLAITVITTPPVTPITGPAGICLGGTATYMETDSTGTWSSSTSSVATIGSTGLATSVAVGVDTIAYTATNMCGTVTRRKAINVITAPAALPAITGATSVCERDTIHLVDFAPGGTWRSTNPPVAMVGGGGPGGAVGVVRATTTGTTTIFYTVTNACGSDSVSVNITVNPLPLVYPITCYRDSVCSGSILTLAEFATGGTWTSQTPSVATVDVSGNVTGVVAGVDSIFYSLTNSCGTTTAAFPVYVDCPHNVGVANITPASNITIYPNPANDFITIEGTNPSSIQVVNIYGQMVCNVKNTTTVSLATLPGGVYYVTVLDQDGNVAMKQSVVKK